MTRRATLAGLPLLLFPLPAPAAQQGELAPWDGGPQPIIRLRDLQGMLHDLAAHAGHVVLVHFFATWCGPCRPELLSLGRLLENGRLSIRVVGLSIDETPGPVQRLLAQAPVRFPIVLDTDRAVAKAWRVRMLPTTFVLDQALEPRLRVEGALEWDRPEIVAVLERMAGTTTSR